MNWSQISLLSLEDLIKWADTQKWCQAMASCLQDESWHAEGDVWTHTKMVTNQLRQLPEWNALTPHERTVLTFTALFHDSAKPLTSERGEDGRVHSPKHAIKGEHLARNILRDASCPFPVREQICRMVRFHGRPTFLLEKSDPDREVISLSYFVNNRLLHLFALADYRGRDTDGDERSEDTLNLWKECADENKCLDHPFVFPNDQARFLFFKNPLHSIHYVPHEEYRCVVTMVAGLPGSGKDTWLKNNYEGPVVSLDGIREDLDIDPTDNQGEVAQAARAKCCEYLRSKTSFAFNATNLLRQMRQKWINLFADYGARIELVYIEPPSLELIIEQNKKRERVVPESVIRSLADKCEPPTITEVHGLVIKDD